MEDFSFADFIHLAVFHKRDIFAPCPVGLTPRTWNSNSLHPALTTSHLLSEQHDGSSRGRPRHSRASRQSPVGAKAAHVDTEDNEKVKLDAEEKRLRSVEIPEMQKWAKLLQSGGASCNCPGLWAYSPCLRRDRQASPMLLLLWVTRHRTKHGYLPGKTEGPASSMHICKDISVALIALNTI